MDVCIVGGVFGAPSEYQKVVTLTPEITLAAGLRERGIQVTTVSHRDWRPRPEHDIVHVHHLGRGALRVASERGMAAFVFTAHNGEIMSGYERSAVRKWGFRYVIGRCDAIVALSEREKTFFGDYANRGQKIAVIPNGIYHENFHPDAAGNQRQPGPVRFLFVGQLVPLKGVDVLLKALARIAADCSCTLSLVYQRSEDEQRYRNLTRELGVDRITEFVGAVPSDALGDVYRRADILVLPSLAEALPSVITESLLCGTPVVASRVGGIPDQIGPYGITVSPGSVADLATGMRTVLNQLDALKARAIEMHKYARSKYDPGLMIEKHIALYSAVLENKRTPGRRTVGDRLVSFAAEMKR